METILAKIVEAKRKWLFAKKRLFPQMFLKMKLLKQIEVFMTH